MGLAAKKTKTNQEYNDLLAKLDDIPTLPIVAMKVNELINDPNSSASDIAEILKKDQVLTAKILRLANSSYYSIPGGVSDVQRALAFLGFNTIAQLILGISVISIFKKIQGEDFSMMSFWRHALGTAVCAELLAKRLKVSKPEEAFTCGLLHDIGKLVMHEIDPDRLDLIIRETKKNSCSFFDVEKQWDLPGHSFLGEIIAKRWGLPQQIQLSIRYHHFDVTNMDSILASAKPVIQIVRLSNQLCVKNQIGKSGDCSAGDVSPDMIDPLGIHLHQVPEIEDQLKTQMERAGAFLSVGM